MMTDQEAARAELVALGEALTLAEGERAEDGGVAPDGPRPTPVALMARLLRVAALHPDSVGRGILFQVADLVAEGDAAYGDKVAAVRMGWAAVVQAVRRHRGMAVVGGRDHRPPSARTRARA